MPKEIHHTALSVDDIDRSLGLYRDILGMEVEFDLVIEDLPEFAEMLGMQAVRERLAMLRLNNSRIELYQFYEPQGKKLERKQCDIGYMHVAFLVDELEGICNRLKDKGFTFYSEPKEVGAYRVAFFRGFDNETIELIQLIGS